MHDDDLYADQPLGIGSIQQLSDQPHDTGRKLPLGFPIPQGDDVTAYRERMKQGAYNPPDATKSTRRPRKRATTKRKTTRKK